MSYSGLFEISYPCAKDLISFAFMSRDGLDFIANQIRTEGLAAYEAPTPGLLVSLVQGTPGAVLDIGANTGVFTLLAVASNPGVQVFAFEPLERIRSILADNLALNPDLKDRVHVEPFALSKETGSFSFFETVNEHGFLTTSSSLELSHAESISSGHYREQRVQTLTLDAWADEHLGEHKLRLMKIDVESHEHAVIEGGRATIAKHRPMIVLEVLPTAELEPIGRMVAQEHYLDFAIAPHALRQAFRFHNHGDATNHLLCPIEQVDQVFRLARQHRLAIELA